MLCKKQTNINILFYYDCAARHFCYVYISHTFIKFLMTPPSPA